MNKRERKLIEHPKVDRARERRQAVERELDAAVEARMDAQEALEATKAEPADTVSTGGERSNAAEQAHEALEEARQEERIARIALEKAREAEDRAKQEAAREIREELEEQYADAVQELYERIHVAADANDRVRAIYRHARRLFGGPGPDGEVRPLPRLHWPALVRERTPVQSDTRIAAWERLVERSSEIELNGH